ALNGQFRPELQRAGRLDFMRFAVIDGTIWPNAKRKNIVETERSVDDEPILCRLAVFGQPRAYAMCDRRITLYGFGRGTKLLLRLSEPPVEAQMHPSQIVYLDWKWKTAKDLGAQRDNRIFRSPGKMAVVEIVDVAILDSMQVGPSRQAV